MVNMSIRTLSFACMQYKYETDLNRKEITIQDKPIGGFLLFDVPFYCSKGVISPVGDIRGNIKSLPFKTILSITLHDKCGRITKPKYFFCRRK